MTRNSAFSETALLNDYEQRLRSWLPPSWRLTSTGRTSRVDGGLDLRLTVAAPDGASSDVMVQTWERIEPRDVHTLAAKRRNDEGQAKPAIVFVSQFITPMARTRMLELDIGWFDQTGNAHLRLDSPSVLIDRKGADRNPATDPEDLRLRSLRGPATARVVRAILDTRGPVGVRELAAMTSASVATTGKVVELLTREDLVSRDTAGNIVDVHKRQLMRRWAHDYHFTKTNRTHRMLAPRGIPRLLDSSTTFPLVLTGSAALRAYLPEDTVPVTPLNLLACYVLDIDQAAQDLGLKKADRGANVLLLKPFDDAIIAEARHIAGRRYATPVQTVADLLGSPGRGPEEAEQLIDHLAIDDKGWQQ